MKRSWIGEGKKRKRKEKDTANNIGDEGAESVSELLKINTALRRIGLEGDKEEQTNKKRGKKKRRMKQPTMSETKEQKNWVGH